MVYIDKWPVKGPKDGFLETILTSTPSTPSHLQYPNGHICSQLGISIPESKVFLTLLKALSEHQVPTEHTVIRKWFTHMSPIEESRPNREFAVASPSRLKLITANK